ncbi:MAG: glycosyltransferase 87 family protein [bacterium]|nr:glycosyltransferase 87 family protein [bacterium]
MDWQAFWSAFQLFRSGGNPYDPISLYEVQQAAGSGIKGVLMFWNPPWFFAALWPVLVLPIETSVQVWFGLNLVFALITGVISWKIARPGEDVPPLPCVLTSLMFFPLYPCLWFGQLGLFVVLCLVVGCFLSIRGYDRLGALFLFFSTVKLHLVIPFVTYYAFLVLSQRRRATVLSTVLFFTAISGVLLLENPDVYFHWLNVVVGGVPQSGIPENWVVSPMQWRTQTFATIIRSYAGKQFDSLICWSMAGTGVILAVLLLRTRRGGGLANALPYLLCLSVIFSPYAWIHDYVLLLPVQVMVVAQALRTDFGSYKRVFTLFAVIAIQCVSSIPLYIGSGGHMVYVWIPVVLLLLWHFACADAYRQEHHCCR